MKPAGVTPTMVNVAPLRRTCLPRIAGSLPNRRCQKFWLISTEGVVTSSARLIASNERPRTGSDTQHREVVLGYDERARDLLVDGRRRQQSEARQSAIGADALAKGGPAGIGERHFIVRHRDEAAERAEPFTVGLVVRVAEPRDRDCPIGGGRRR